MKASKHVANTWLLAQLIHAIIFLIISGEGGMLVFALIGGFVLSIPSLLLCLLFIKILPIHRVTILFNFLVWTLLVFTSIAINWSGIALLLGDVNFFSETTIFLPSLIAAALSLLIRFNQFEELSITETLANEN